ncbi:hypothetical protein KBC80_03455 [Candidatus Woesebacteria bacterium]|nr:hypothetical protein [Candidatus Woesebacteria bacterium]
MEARSIPINQIDSMSRAGRYFSSFTRQIKAKGAESLPPIPVFQLPKELNTELPYSNMDGGHRLSAHIAAGETEIRCIVFGPNDDPEEISSLTGGGHPISYDACIRTYKRRRGL